MSKRSVIILLSIVVLSFISVMILQALSKKKFTTYLAFTRVLRKDLIKQKDTFDLRHAYYIAGTTSENFYLGSFEDPLDLLAINSTLSAPRHVRLSIVNGRNLNLTGSMIKIDSPFFYITVGDLPGIFKGTLDHWEASPMPDRIAPFSQAVPIASDSYASVSKNSGGVRILNKIPEGLQTKLNPDLRGEQSDTLSADGMLRYCKELNQLIFVYYYRDEYVVMDSSLNVVYRTSTIDTLDHAHIRPVEFFEPDLVNLDAQVYKGFLFVRSNLVAMNEDIKFVNENVSVIDVYHIKDNRYSFSFYIPDYKKMKMNSFRITRDGILVLYGNYAVTYVFNGPLHFAKPTL